MFQDYAAGNGFTAGETASRVALTLLLRTGRSQEYKREMLKRLWRMLQDATGWGDDQIVPGIQEVPPSQAMEMGKIMPDVADQRCMTGKRPSHTANCLAPSPRGVDKQRCKHRGNEMTIKGFSI